MILEKNNIKRKEWHIQLRIRTIELQVVIILCLLSCNWNKTVDIPKNSVASDSSFTIITETAYGCKHIISLSSNGHGALQKFNNLGVKLRDDTFNIPSLDTLQKIHQLISLLVGKADTVNKISNDIMLKFILKVNDSLVYRSDGDLQPIEFKRLFLLVSGYFPFKIDIYCNDSLII